jgi:hypothetical protein
VSVLVRDADTKKPIPQAEVRLGYPLATSPLAPGEVFTTTAADGVAHLRAAAYGDAGIVVQVGAKGYLSEEKVVSHEAVGAIEPAGLFEAVEERPVSLIVDLYRDEPRPTVDLVVPAGFLGLIQVDVKAERDRPAPPGQRRFCYDVPPNGVLQVNGPDLFRHLNSPDFRARYAGGRALRPDAGDSEVGFWCLKVHGQRYTFLVGSRREFDFRRDRVADETGDRPVPADHRPAGQRR